MRRWSYLELSNEAHHKFYEVTILGSSVRLRWGRIEYPGRSLLVCLDSKTAAGRFAARKLREKCRKGYRRAIPGVRRRRLPQRPEAPPPRQLLMFEES